MSFLETTESCKSESQSNHVQCEDSSSGLHRKQSKARGHLNVQTTVCRHVNSRNLTTSNNVDPDQIAMKQFDVGLQ